MFVCLYLPAYVMYGDDCGCCCIHGWFVCQYVQIARMNEARRAGWKNTLNSGEVSICVHL